MSLLQGLRETEGIWAIVGKVRAVCFLIVLWGRWNVVRAVTLVLLEHQS